MVDFVAQGIIDNFYVGKRDEENINNRNVVKAMTDISGRHFWKAGDEIRNDRSFYMKVLEKDGQAIIGANGNFKISRVSKMADDKEACMLAAETYSNVLEHVSHRLRSDKDLVMKIAELYGESALYYVGDKLRFDRDIAYIILWKNGKI